MTWTRSSTTKCHLRCEVESTGRNFSKMPASFALRQKEAGDGRTTCVLLRVGRAPGERDRLRVVGGGKGEEAEREATIWNHDARPAGAGGLAKGLRSNAGGDGMQRRVLEGDLYRYLPSRCKQGE